MKISRLFVLLMLALCAGSCAISGSQGTRFTNPDTAFLYNSCKEGLASGAFKQSYCYAQIAGFAKSMYALNAFIVLYKPDAPTCAGRKTMAYHDLGARLFYASGKLPTSRNIAQNFVEWVDRGGKALKLPLPIQSPADTALASSMIGTWGSYNSPYEKDRDKLFDKEVVDDWSKMWKFGDKKTLHESCKQTYRSTAFNTSTCRALISGALVAYGIYKYRLPVYAADADCSKEKNEIVNKYASENLKCFPRGENYKKNIARDLAEMRGDRVGDQNTRIHFRYRCE